MVLTNRLKFASIGISAAMLANLTKKRVFQAKTAWKSVVGRCEQSQRQIVLVDNRSYGNAHLTYYRKVN